MFFFEAIDNLSELAFAYVSKVLIFNLLKIKCYGAYLDRFKNLISFFILLLASRFDDHLEDLSMKLPDLDTRFGRDSGSSLAVVHDREFSEETALEVDDVRCVFTFALKY